jgi:hypothetical protein
MLRLKICRNQRGGLFLCNSGTQYNKIEDVWTDCIGTPWDKLYPEVTFENSPMEVELKIKKNGLHFSPMFRLLGMIINKDPSDRKRIVGYTKKLIDNLKEEGFDADARVAEDYLKAFNGEQVGMATMDEVELKLIEK